MNNEQVSIIDKITKIDREATKQDFEKATLSLDTENALNTIHPEILNEASKYNLSYYYSNKLATRRSFFRRLTSEQIMKWSNLMITKPLLELPSELEDTALQCFKNLLSYMGDRKSSKKPLSHLKKHLKLTLNAPEDLKDESYIQVLRQIRENKDYDKSMRGWNFLAILASCYAPSIELYYSILNYLIYEIRNNLDVNIVKRSNYILIRLSRSFEQKRKQIPSDKEILHIEHMKPFMFPVHFFSETSTFMQTESYTTVRELKTNIMRRLQLNISRIPYYSLFEVCNKKDTIEERFLDDSDLIVDIASVWEKETEMNLKRNTQIEFKIYIKIQLYYGYNDKDLDTISMHYVQTCYDVNKGKFNLKENDIIQLAAIQLMVNYSNSPHEEVFKNLERSTEIYVPINKLDKSNKSNWCEKIMSFYTTLNCTNKLESKLTYLERLKQNNMWEAHQFFINYSKSFNVGNPENFPEKLIIGIKPTGLTIQDNDRNELMFLPYSGIASWGVNNSLFVVVIQKNEVEIVKHYFESNQTKLFQLLIESYTNLIVGKSITEVMNNTVNSTKRFDAMPSIALEKGETARSKSCSVYKKTAQ